VKTKTRLLTIPLLALLFVLWIVPGIVARDPWKADEPYSFGIVQDMIRTGDVIVPTLTGELFMEKPPLFFATAALFGRVFSPPLDPFFATRLATVFFMFLALVFVGLTASELYGKESFALAVILLIGCLNLQVTAHKLITDVALFAGFSIGFYGLALSLRRPAAGGFWLGIGTGIGFLSKGVIAPGMLGVTALALPLLFAAWRKKQYLISLGSALTSALPWLVVWPALLYERSPQLFRYWIWDQNFGRFLGFNTGAVGFNPASPDSHAYYILNLVWIAWPVVVPAFWALWHFRQSWRNHAAYQLPLVSFLVILAVLSASTTNRVLYALPLLLPVTLLAVPGTEALPPRAKAVGSWAGFLFFGLAALVLWFGWIAMMTGVPAALAQKLHDFQPDYIPALSWPLFCAAVLYTAAWLVLAAKSASSPDRVALTWTLGAVLAWGLIMTLWLPALNSGSSFRADFTDLRNSLPQRYSCVASSGLGESERAMLEYFTGIRTRRTETAGPGNCDLLLEQRAGQFGRLAGPDWQEIWQRRHPSVKPKDIFTLYRKKPPVL
jgi:4-amino-4-deoxy-L-arabinose transferase-like glycosyltransferase